MLRQIRPIEIMAGEDSDSRYSPERDWRDELEIMEYEAAMRAQATQKILPETGAPTKAEAAPVNVPKPQNTPKIQLENGKPTTTVTASANISKPQSTPKIPETDAPSPVATAPANVANHQSTPGVPPANGAPILAFAAPANVPEPQSTKFPKGKSGNPAGRPRGSRNKTSPLKDYLLEHENEQLVRILVDMALEGDKQALKLCIDRLVPRCSEAAIEIYLGPTENLEQVNAATSRVLEAVGAGRITPSQAKELIDILKFKYEGVFGYCAHR